MSSPLDGIRVIDLSRFIAGPHCTMILGDMGAEVIKVEKKGVGDDSRHLPPFRNGESLYCLALNRNKRSIELNFREAKAQEILRELIATADVLVENFRPGTMEQMGLGWDEVHALNPRCIMTRLSGFGQTGPYSQLPGFDGIAQAMSGLMSLAGQPDGPPALAGTFFVDYMTGMYGATATISALYARQSTGRGQLIDISLLDSATAMLTTAIAAQADLGETLTRIGNRDRYSAPCNVFETKEGEFVLLLSGTDPLFRRLAHCIGRPELATDPRFLTVADRLAHVDELEEIVAAWFKKHGTEEAIAAVRDAGAPCAKVATPQDVVENPQLRFRQQIVSVEHPTVGECSMAGVTMRLSDTPLEIRKAPPRLGEHTDEILTEMLGLTHSDVAALREAGVV